MNSGTTTQPTTSQYESDAELYTLAMTTAAAYWIAEHGPAYRKMVDGTMGQYRGKQGEFALRMAGLMRACATASGFPSFAVWLNRRGRKDAA